VMVASSSGARVVADLPQIQQPQPRSQSVHRRERRPIGHGGKTIVTLPPMSRNNKSRNDVTAAEGRFRVDKARCFIDETYLCAIGRSARHCEESNERSLSCK